MEGSAPFSMSTPRVMSSADMFFSSPAVNPVQICRQVLSVYFSGWMTFMSLSGIQFAFYFIMLFFLSMYIIFLIMTGETNQSDIQDSEYYGSASIAYSFGRRGLIDGDVNYDCDSYYSILDLAALLLPFLPGLIILGVPTLIVMSAFHGATVRVAAETYAGLDHPENQLCCCLKDGWMLKWRITIVVLLMAIPNFIAGLVVTVVVPNTLCSAGFAQFLNSTWFLILKSIVLLLIRVLTCAAFAASTSMIVVEKIPAIDAVKSSWKLCSSSFGFVFWSLFSCFVLKRAAWMCMWYTLFWAGTLQMVLPIVLLQPLDDM
jgi:hypothetical protein